MTTRFQFSVSVFGSATQQSALDAAHDLVTACVSRDVAERLRFVDAELEGDDVEPGWEEWTVTCEGRMSAAARALL
jgi:hypothetical protein